MDEAQLIGFERVTGSGVLSKKPCLLYSICGVGVADATNVFTIHDGQTSSGKVRMKLVTVAYNADFRLFASPVFFAKGIYVAFTTNGTEVTAQVMQLAR